MTKDEKFHYWQQHIDAWRQSGKAQRAFCADSQLSFSTFSYWRTKINRDKNRENPWVPVQLAGSSTTVAVSLPGGIRLEVPVVALAEVLPTVYRSLQDNG